MTDNEIFKALEYCSSHDDCDLNCPIAKETTEDEGCIRIIGRLALDIINRLKAENERLQGELIVERTRRENAVNAYHEARKEFAERLKKETLIDSGYEVLQIGTIDNLLAEMESVDDDEL